MIYVDLLDAVEQLGQSGTVTGIQRVQLELARHLSASHPVGAEFVIGTAGNRVRVAQIQSLNRLLRALDNTRTDRDGLRSELASLRETSIVRELTTADAFVATGMFWSSSATMSLMLRTKFSGGRAGFLCHDLIPITHRQYCPEVLTTLFEQSLSLMLDLADFAVTNSHHVQAELTAHVRRSGIDLPIAAVPLARDVLAGDATEQPSAEVAELLSGKFVLFLSTIEPRKNHALTLAVWERLLARMSPEIVPDLIWAGKHGFRSDEVVEAAGRSTRLRNKLHCLPSVSDVDVRALLRNCWCTIFPSHVEGWGLPVAESLAFGKPCLAAATSSIPEVGGSLAWYFNPGDVDEATRLMASLIEEPDRVANRAKEIRETFQRRSWSEVAIDFEAVVSGLVVSSPSRPITNALRLRPGRAYTARSFSDRPPLGKNEAFVRQTLFNEGWFAAEAWGRWMKEPGGRLQLHLPRFEGPRPCQVYLAVVTMPSWKGHTLRIVCRETGFEAVATLRAGQSYRVFMDMTVPGGFIDLELIVDRFDPVAGTDPRLLSIGVVEIGLVHVGDVARIDLEGAEATGRTVRLTARPIGRPQSWLESWLARMQRMIRPH